MTDNIQAIQRIGTATATAANGSALVLVRSQGTIASPTIISNGDEMGRIVFQGYDGASRVNSVQIIAEVDGAPGANDMPGRLLFKTTADGASTPTERMRIDNAGLVGIGATPVAGRRLYAYTAPTDPAVASYAMYSLSQKSVATADVTQSASMGVMSTWSGAGNYTSQISGIFGTNYFAGSGTMTTQYGMWFLVGSTGDNDTGAVTTRAGAVVQNFSTSNKPCTNSYGLLVRNMAAYNSPTTTAGVYIESSTTAVGTNKYGLLIGDQSGATNNYAIYTGTGINRFGDNTKIAADSKYLYFGAGDDATITYDGTNLVINPRVVGSGATIFNPGNVGIGTTSPSYKLEVNGTTGLDDNVTIADGKNIILNTTNGTKIGTATSQKLGFWNATPIVQPTTAVAEAAFVENAGGTAVNVDSTFGGYTLQQVVKALQNAGLLA